MQGFDVNRFLDERGPDWRELEAILGSVEDEGVKSLGLDGARRFGKLYRHVSSDLIQARTELVDASVVDYLNDLVARAYSQIHAGQRQKARGLFRYFLVGYPQLVRAEWKAIAMSAAILLSGGVLGASLVAVDPDALGVLIPEDHQELTPQERIERDEGRGAISGSSSAAFSSFLFTHNIKVTFLVFALGLTFGFGTVGVLFYNGVPLGALAMQYHQAGQDTFFWAWILPHGFPELTSVFIAGGAGLVLARALWLPGRRRRLDALSEEGKRAAHLVVGTMPVLVGAGLIEGTISQLHEPVIPAWSKLLFAGLIAIALFSWLGLAGRKST